MTSVLRYIERNPVRASMVANAEDYRWSSAAAHLGQSRYPAFLDQAAFVDRWTVNEWRELLRARQAKGEVQQIRSATRQGRPLGSDEFLDDLSKHWNLELPRVTPNYAVRQPPQRITTFREAALLSAN